MYERLLLQTISQEEANSMQGIPNKGILLTQMSRHWFDLIHSQLPSLRTHLISTDLPTAIQQEASKQLEGRSMQVQKLSIVPLESIVRGYITGSAWAEYKTHGTVHGMPMPSGLRESQKLERPIWTPSTKAQIGDHDENISKESAAKIVGVQLTEKIEKASLQIYEMVGYEQLSIRLGLIADSLMAAEIGSRLRSQTRYHHSRHQVRIRS